jgi:preprotein translocase subunit SecB
MSESTNSPSIASFRFQNFIVKESHIIINEQGENKISIDFSPKGYVFFSLSQFHLEMNVEVKEESNNFNIQLNTISVFEFDATSENFNQFRDDYFVRNAPAIVFPYIRAYISNLTTQSGLFTVQLPTLNLNNLADALKANIVETE